MENILQPSAEVRVVPSNRKRKEAEVSCTVESEEKVYAGREEAEGYDRRTDKSIGQRTIG